MTCQWHKLLPYSTWLLNPRYQTSLACKRFCSDPNPADLMQGRIKGQLINQMNYNLIHQSGCTRQNKMQSHLSQVGQSIWLSQTRASPSTWPPGHPDGHRAGRCAAVCRSGSPSEEPSDHTWGLQWSQRYIIRLSSDFYLGFYSRLQIRILTTPKPPMKFPQHSSDFSIFWNQQISFDPFITTLNQSQQYLHRTLTFVDTRGLMTILPT